ncbi:UDP-N-acetylglucosamine 1-carboxyvinyltransferase [Desulfococcus multivorans]|jgi:UDP-N-acetylglucosamine 1-carboxyvinyltransferase|uniref:UDP-N-acetylglucosamine 1-carboxyvinyltransferase n=2 Tax=Desulfococcus TaxID=896 RepID=S7U693_DESML|nr:UDP-N-acetylglucosamine 1-carboxyvinyltransferase [Desulfococcus multivorans]AOY60225.1 MurA: UDP-N-acetylglucosamine 1-carboxyvinyltransferase [Desulfococcus multivorans]AQV02340.1 UDP-N-acetylglucosamine 1-carboxyvinyltransferase [Desulfococcus multivorans]EPR44615.1 UDP-N-acetylglucosamine 1-carboxyvinyltransferase [Desulfococcus multivorans DSM 2059]MDX9818059.1 UDP-N-acetylglucosamine 1-carboxyvinyltransferase [Desulfococcus multivorans]SKA07140.1 UDP-N-acetylglucosamine 1-carboxyvinyl
MDKIIVEGGHPLKGEVVISGAKNAALPILTASLLTEGRNTYHNVPGLKDVESIKALLAYLCADVETDGDTVYIRADGLCKSEAPYDLVRKMRASILVLGPLLARVKKARVSLPGGCAIGARPINLHLKGLARLGAVITLEHGYVEASADRLVGDDIYFDMPTVTGTENLMMAAVLAEGTTVLRNVAREPEIIALADVLNRMGADVRGAGSSVITIHGVPQLHPAEVTIIPDRIEAGTFMAAAALTRGDVTLRRCEPDHLQAVIDKLRLTGAEVTVEKDTVRVRGGDEIASVDIKTLPYPGFPTDMQAQFMVLMSVARGLSLITETIFENRYIHVSELRRLGADITVSGNAAMVKGVPRLSGAPVMATDLRASASLILAGLVARGKTEINRVYHLDRGYDAIEKKMAALGAAVWRV